ncbi:unnamed protein product [Thlaspi arvense]|uniref:J domain-containing protein n=1 Tax=Thlaspi arvense TaxID=13288 RepID=A0AAU9S504_THLAR|nr:unnamed protein product [Thlaspi arvense]
MLRMCALFISLTILVPEMRFAMDCNKEEAARAKKLAEEKMIAGDFAAAHKFLLTAQRLFPELGNILQMIAVCDVHSSAEKKIKGLDNWYAILQVQFLADADTIRKQYRKLALLLHPDKNKFAGAESAFKLVGEANRCLSDKIKRFQYDVRYRSHMMLANQSSANSGRPCSAANNATENLASGYSFWTCCKNCGQRYKYLKEYMNKFMHCSNCKCSYIACDIGSGGVISRENASTGAAEMETNGTVGGKLNKKNQQNQKTGGGDRKPKKDEACKENDAAGEKPQKGEEVTDNSAEIPKPDVLKPQPKVDEAETNTAKSTSDLSAPKKNQAAKKRRKSVEESSNRFEFDGSDVAGAKKDTNESNKRTCEFESGFNTKQTAEDTKSPGLADSGVSPASSHAKKRKARKVNSRSEDILSANNKVSEGCDGNGADAALSKSDEVENGYKANVFDEARKLECFAVNQVWSTCDSRDGMPRRYARVKKVLASECKLRITYLEPVRENHDESIPVACGKFKNGETKEVKDRSIFSGQMSHSFCNKIATIHPKKGEIWAIFRDWNEEWTTSVEKHKLPYQYDFVEIVNNFKHDHGIGVAYLGKIKGFVYLFHQEARNGVCQIQFPPEELLRFSHKVPAVRMTGKEKECVPGDSYELDPTALPNDTIQVDVVNRETMSVPEIATSPRKRRKSGDYYSGGCSNLGEVKGRSRRRHDFSYCQVDEKSTPNESRKNGEAADVFKLRKSPRLQPAPSQQRDEKKSDIPKETDRGSLVIRKPPNGIHQPAENQEEESSKKQGRNCELQSLYKQNDLPTQLDGSTNETTLVSSSCKTPRRNASEFENQRGEDKFRVNQVWAIYSNGMPREYVKIKKIDTKAGFRLHVTRMELNPPSAEPVTRPVSCGEFKLKTEKPKIIARTSFSHKVNPVDAKRNIVKVYPRKGEIWALYKNCDSTNEEHDIDIVEVVEDYCDGREIAKAVALTAKESSSQHVRSVSGFMAIPKSEMSNRFSHQIPAIRHQKRRTRLSVGEEHWELDQTAIPGRTIVS